MGQMAIAIAFPGFNDLGPSVTPVFLLMDHFLYQFSALSEKNEGNLSTRSLNFLQNARSNSVLFSSSFIGATVKFGIVYATHLLLQNKTKIVCLR